jgi:hypothetical protein
MTNLETAVSQQAARALPEQWGRGWSGGLNQANQFRENQFPLAELGGTNGVPMVACMFLAENDNSQVATRAPEIGLNSCRVTDRGRVCTLPTCA